MLKVRRVNPFKCRMWAMHDRLGEAGSNSARTAMLDSFKMHGQKQPALGRLVADEAGYEVELIYGARRLFAARELGVDLLVELRDVDDRSALIEMDIENRVREDISAYERGISYKRWLRSGMFQTQAEIAKALSISEAQICRLLKYAELPAVVVGAFRSPSDIREEWAGTLVKLVKDKDLRTGLLRRARRISSSSKRLSSQQVFDMLVNEQGKRIVQVRYRDEVVKGSDGTPLFRIGFRAKAVHLIVPRESLTSDALQHLAEQLKTSLEPAGCTTPSGPA